MKILLLGYMGSGKSTIGSLLAEKLELPFIDLDYAIKIAEGMSINAIFQQKGEIYFRKRERQLFSDFMQSQDSFVLSLGGGTPCYANNHELLNGNRVVSFYLKTSVTSLLNRLKLQNEVRPLLSGKSDDEMRDYIAQHLFERSYFYHQATVVVTTDDKSPQAIADEIKDYLR